MRESGSSGASSPPRFPSVAAVGQKTGVRVVDR
jgi:hypothetical protein